MDSAGTSLDDGTDVHTNFFECNECACRKTKPNKTVKLWPLTTFDFYAELSWVTSTRQWSLFAQLLCQSLSLCRDWSKRKHKERFQGHSLCYVQVTIDTVLNFDTDISVMYELGLKGKIRISGSWFAGHTVFRHLGWQFGVLQHRWRPAQRVLPGRYENK